MIVARPRPHRVFKNRTFVRLYIVYLSKKKNIIFLIKNIMRFIKKNSFLSKLERDFS